MRYQTWNMKLLLLTIDRDMSSYISFLLTFPVSPDVTMCLPCIAMWSPVTSWPHSNLSNVHFGKTHFMDPNIDARLFFRNLKNNQAQLFYVLRFSLRYLKTAQKPVRISKNAEKWPNHKFHFLDILFKDRCSGNSVKYISCLFWGLEDWPKWKIGYC